METPDVVRTAPSDVAPLFGANGEEGARSPERAHGSPGGEQTTSPLEQWRHIPVVRGELIEETPATEASSSPPQLLPRRVRVSVRHWSLSRASRRDVERQMWFKAAASGTCSTLVTLLNRGAVSVNARGDWSTTALHKASEGGHADAVALLLQAGAELDAVDPEAGWTALHFAAYRGKANVVRRLLMAEADTEVRDFNNRTPAQLASQPGGALDTCKAACLELLDGWGTAVPGEPVLVRLGVQTQDIYYFRSEEGEREALHAEALPPPIAP